MTDLPVGDLIKYITDDVKRWCATGRPGQGRSRSAAKNGGMGAGLFAGAGYFAISALSVLYLAAGFGLADLFDWGSGSASWSSVILLFLVAGICGGIGSCWSRRSSRRRRPSPRPTRR